MSGASFLSPYIGCKGLSGVGKSRKPNKDIIQAEAGLASKLRADALLLARGLSRSRDRARDLIAEGAVLVDGQPVLKASKLLEIECNLEVTSTGNPWVSRAGIKLAGGLAAFPMIAVAGRYALDIGASTGGFTEVLLSHHVGHVVAIDVGSGQLAAGLAADARVTVLDGTNARYLRLDMLQQPPQLVVCDASFISLKKVLVAAMDMSAAGADLLALIKPQFEVGKGLVGKGGIVREPHLHDMVIADIEGWLVTEMGWHHIGTVPSPIDGPDGNREFLLAGKKPE